MLKMRLQRVGRVHEPSFRLVLTDSMNSTKSGRFGEILGSYDPRKKIDVLDSERIKYWLTRGASPTDTVHNLLVRHKIINAKKIDVSSVLKKTPSPKVAVGEPPVKEPESEKASEEPAPAGDVIVEEAPAPALGEAGVPAENVGEETV